LLDTLSIARAAMWNLSGKESYRGSGKLTGKRAVITGVDSGIERAVAAELATAYVMLADPLSSYVSEQQSRLPAGSRFCRGADAAHFRCGRHSNFRGASVAASLLDGFAGGIRQTAPVFLQTL
jgi:hypothetical protein